MIWKNWLENLVSLIQPWAYNILMYNPKIIDDYGNKEITILLPIEIRDLSQ